MLSRPLACTLATSIAAMSAACGGPEGLEGGDPTATTGEVAQEVGAGVAHIHFGADWSRTVNGRLFAGGQVRVTYDADRLPQCRGDVDGVPAYTITAFAKVNDGGVHSAVVHGFASDGRTAVREALFDLGVAGELQLWFQVTNRWGCSNFDSDFGRNFRFPIDAEPEARLQFDQSWNETLHGTLRRGGFVIVDYDLARLPACRATYRGFVAWDLVAYYRFDGGSPTRLTITRGSTDRYSVPTAIAIPSGARDLELWFHNNDSDGCSRYDSNFGANYGFAITR